MGRFPSISLKGLVQKANTMNYLEVNSGIACNREPKGIYIICLKCMIYAECSANVFRAISHFINAACDSELESAGVLLCSWLLPRSPPISFCPNPSLPFKGSRHGLGFHKQTKGLLGFTACVRSCKLRHI